MNEKEIFRTVAERAKLSREEAADLTRATLLTLADRLSGGEARDLAAQLPEPLREPLQSADQPAKRFGLDEFNRRISKHTGLSAAETAEGIRAVLTTLRDASAVDEFGDVMAQLPKEFRTLVESAA